MPACSFGTTAPGGASNSPEQSAAAPGEVFDLVDAPDPVDEEPAIEPVLSSRRGTQPVAPADVPRRERTASPPRDDSRLDPSELVPEPWSRWSEWGMNLIVLGAWMAVLLFLLYILFGMEFYGLAFALLLVGAVVSVVLSYPILITLERPVRITPEQALRDYYTALSHHVPHFRRMWLLAERRRTHFLGVRVAGGVQGILERAVGPPAPGARRAANPARLRSDQL